MKEGLEEKLKFLLIGHAAGHVGEQTVKTVDKDHLVRTESHGRLAEVTQSGLEIIVRDLHLFTGDQPGEVLIDQS